ncbi:MAG: hypothetical protein UW92_C0045G0001 [Candidatus Jorgensenbacteria bacterium GW2011_GWA2_45_13]|uniref:Uncharacterized protein n=1 Tax=Candidatus Jorgensenbacteria bacterium GW2011_GWA2_45_13 TaxID=1618662 RepID=A0A0G1L208_9BACT|nr:MAG: hypothetical protein UW92_C0045G0001 [Candidatus Jorgensenbacteria bacterium GW2011_GWA2_45_13]
MKIILDVRFWGKLFLRFTAYLVVYAFALAEGCFLTIPRAFILQEDAFAKAIGIMIALVAIFFPLMIHDAMRSAYKRERWWYEFDRRFL